MSVVVAPVGGDVRDASAEETCDDDRRSEFGEGCEVESGTFEPTPRVQVRDVGRDRQAETIEVKGERP
jgi:hypothetical protein